LLANGMKVVGEKWKMKPKNQVNMECLWPGKILSLIDTCRWYIKHGRQFEKKTMHRDEINLVKLTWRVYWQLEVAFRIKYKIYFGKWWWKYHANVIRPRIHNTHSPHILAWFSPFLCKLPTVHMRIISKDSKMTYSC
jgi:hypothetical protein